MDMRLTRRRMLTVSGALVAGLALAGCRRGGVPPEPDRYTCQEAPGARILVAYVTRYGSTAEVARAIGETLCELGLRSEVREIGQVSDLDRYHGLVLGGPIYYGRWLPALLDFVAAGPQRLLEVPVAFFATCTAVVVQRPDEILAIDRYMVDTGGEVPLVSRGIFAGVYNPTLARLDERVTMAALGVPPGDHRDWEAITAWAGNLMPGAPI